MRRYIKGRLASRDFFRWNGDGRRRIVSGEKTFSSVKYLEKWQSSQILFKCAWVARTLYGIASALTICRISATKPIQSSKAAWTASADTNLFRIGPKRSSTGPYHLMREMDLSCFHINSLRVLPCPGGLRVTRHRGGRASAKAFEDRFPFP
jgi:hypothetical protein